MNSINGISERIKKMFMPVEATDVRITTDGNICVATTQGYVSIDKDNHLAYKEGTETNHCQDYSNYISDELIDISKTLEMIDKNNEREYPS